MSKVSVFSETGRLRKVIVHTPGAEVEKMTPDHAQRDLYSDILNLDVAREEYQLFKSVLNRFCQTFEIKDLLAESFEIGSTAEDLIRAVCSKGSEDELTRHLLSLNHKELARQMVEGVEHGRDNLTRYLSNERYSLKPLHNFFFTRDASMTVYNHVVLGKMASPVRVRESVIMETIFKAHPLFSGSLFDPAHQADANDDKVQIEGGDLLVASPDVLVVGIGMRTSTQGVDRLIEGYKTRKKTLQHILVQELPDEPESFIHLDMVFTFLDQETCMIYEPLILGHNQYRTIHIKIENGTVSSIVNEPDLVSALKTCGISVRSLFCGGRDRWHQEREQWHSGANFLALAPGVVLGYERNKHTIEELSKNGFNVVKASDVLKNKMAFPESKTVITLEGSELARGGGGARCMSMPVERDR